MCNINVSKIVSKVWGVDWPIFSKIISGCKPIPKIIKDLLSSDYFKSNNSPSVIVKVNNFSSALTENSKPITLLLLKVWFKNLSNKFVF